MAPNQLLPFCHIPLSSSRAGARTWKISRAWQSILNTRVKVHILKMFLSSGHHSNSCSYYLQGFQRSRQKLRQLLRLGTSLVVNTSVVSMCISLSKSLRTECDAVTFMCPFTRNHLWCNKNRLCIFTFLNAWMVLKKATWSRLLNLSYIDLRSFSRQ